MLLSILHKTEKYTKTDMVYLASNGFWVGLEQAFGTLAAFLLAIAFANFLPKEVFGTYKYVISVVGIFSISTLAGTQTSVTQSIGAGFNGTFLPVLKTRIKWGFLGALAALFFTIYYFLNGNNILAASFLIAAVFIPFMDSFNLYSAILDGHKFFEKSTKYAFIAQTITAILLVLLMILTKNLFVILLTYFIAWTIIRGIFLRNTIKQIPHSEDFDPAIISYGKHSSLIGALGAIASYIDKMLIFNFLGGAEVAIYTFATALPEQIKSLLGSVERIILPRFSENSTANIKSGMMRKTSMLALFLLVIIIIYILIAPFIYSILFPQYIESVIYSQIFSISLLYVAFLPIRAFLKAKKKIKEQYWVYTLTSILQLCFIILAFVFSTGLLGVIVARVLPRIFSCFFSLYYYNKTVREELITT